MQKTVNEAGNEAGSVTVGLPGLVRMRRAHGYKSKVGRRCSNILEMLDSKTAKPADIARQIRDLAGLVSKGEL